MAGLAGIEVVRTVGHRYGLHPLALDDVLSMGQRPKVEAYPGLTHLKIPELEEKVRQGGKITNFYSSERCLAWESTRHWI